MDNRLFFNVLDLSLFEQNYYNNERGDTAYSPKILLKVILYCYSKGIISSRRIEKACEENLIIKALAEDTEQDHDTIATLISTNSEAVKDFISE